MAVRTQLASRLWRAFSILWKVHDKMPKSQVIHDPLQQSRPRILWCAHQWNSFLGEDNCPIKRLHGQTKGVSQSSRCDIRVVEFSSRQDSKPLPKRWWLNSSLVKQFWTHVQSVCVQWLPWINTWPWRVYFLTFLWFSVSVVRLYSMYPQCLSMVYSFKACRVGLEANLRGLTETGL